MKQLNLIRNLFSVAVMMTLACNVSAQVSIRDRIQIMDRDIFNYPESTEAPVKTKKSKTNRIVYSDRAGNQSYEDPYFQRKRSSHGIGTPYYIVGEKNGTYKLVQADPDITGKPKSIIGFLYNSKRHFKEPRKVNYAVFNGGIILPGGRKLMAVREPAGYGMRISGVSPGSAREIGRAHV